MGIIIKNLLELSVEMATLSDMMNVRKLIYGHESEEKSYNLNPFCSMLFYESQYYP